MRHQRARRISRAVLLPLALLVLHCNLPAGLRVLSPGWDEVVVHMPLDLVIDFGETADPQTLTVVLNGQDITDSFQLVPSVRRRVVGTANDLWGAWVLSGENHLALSIRFGSRLLSIHQRFQMQGDPYADAVSSFTPGTGAGFGQGQMDAVVLGGPRGDGLFQGGLDVVSLGLNGVIELEFTDNVIVDGPGVDLTVFENSFLGFTPQLLSDVPFSEPGRVSVSQDGQTWFSFSCPLLQAEAPYHTGCAGVYPVLSDELDSATPHASIPSTDPIEDLIGVDIFELIGSVPGSGGDSFDLADLGLLWASHVRIESASFVDGPVGPDNAGFDLDAVAAVHAAPPTDLDGNGVPDAVE